MLQQYIHSLQFIHFSYTYRLLSRDSLPEYRSIHKTMAGSFGNAKLEPEDEKVWSICRMPFWNSTTGSSSTPDVNDNNNMQPQSQLGVDTHHHSSSSLSSLAMSLFPTRRRLSLDPTNKLFFPCMSSLSFKLVSVIIFSICGYSFYILMFDEYIYIVEFYSSWVSLPVLVTKIIYTWVSF